MKIIYSQLKKWLPKLTASPEQVASDLTLIGHFVDGIAKQDKETIISLEIRQNRGDCLGYFGLAKDLATFYQIDCQNSFDTASFNQPRPKLPIRVTSEENVSRVMAIKIDQVINGPSPAWLSSFLARHEIKSINTLVDLSNYIMLWWGIPNHIFDQHKSGDNLVWQTNQNQFSDFISLDKTKIKLAKDTLIVANNQEVLSLAGIVGGANSKVGENTKTIIAEIAIYNPTKIRQDSKYLKVTTEASLRLEKQLDPQLIPQAFGHLIKLILTNCQGKIASCLYDYYPQPPQSPVIDFDPQKVTAFAGIKIPDSFTNSSLNQLGAKITTLKSGHWLVNPPSYRADIIQEEDLIEEVIRFWGYSKIPTDQPINSKQLPDVTPPIVYLIEGVKKNLIDKGYDEICSWIMIKKTNLIMADFLPAKAKPIYTQNSINNRYPILRSSLVSSLKEQNRQYQKLKIPQKAFFEVGKIFYQLGENYQESYSLAIFDQDQQQLLTNLDNLWQYLGYQPPATPQIVKSGDGWIVEINLDSLVKKLKTMPKIRFGQSSTIKSLAVKELDRQLISLDANVVVQDKIEPQKIISQYQAKINSDYLWQLVITDVYQEGKLYKYTLRAFYYNCSPTLAKKIHQKTFA